jgi:hypothetical protein
MRAAERSGKGAVEDQQDVLLTAKIRQADQIAAVVGQAEVGSDLVESYTCHFASPAMIVAAYDCAFRGKNRRQALVDHNAQSTSSGWKNRRLRRAWLKALFFRVHDVSFAWLAVEHALRKMSLGPDREMGECEWASANIVAHSVARHIVVMRVHLPKQR